jgi:hypothetical protein
MFRAEAASLVSAGPFRLSWLWRKVGSPPRADHRRGYQVSDFTHWPALLKLRSHPHSNFKRAFARNAKPSRSRQDECTSPASLREQGAGFLHQQPPKRFPWVLYPVIPEGTADGYPLAWPCHPSK